MTQPEPRSDCPLAYALDTLGDRWTLLVLRDVLFLRKQRFSDIASREGIATNVLSDRLRRLEDRGLLTRSADPSDGRRTLYRPTRPCLELAPSMIELILWGARHGPSVSFPAEWRERMERDRAGLLAELESVHFADSGR